MTHYIYPQNLKATANMWLWSLRDFAIMGVAALISIVILVELHLMLPAATTLCYGFLTIRIQQTADGLFPTTSCITTSVKTSPTPMKTANCSKKNYGREKKSMS